jgi:hypothetical protein
MKLTKQQRLSVYMIMLAEAENPAEFTQPDDDFVALISNESGYCLMFKLLFGAGDLYFLFKQTLPELWRRMPLGAEWRMYWFNTGEDGWNKRKELLKECINELS